MFPPSIYPSRNVEELNQVEEMRIIVYVCFFHDDTSSLLPTFATLIIDVLVSMLHR